MFEPYAVLRESGTALLSEKNFKICNEMSFYGINR